ncbi:MAG TPA: glycosyltransferase, partial [Ktedonobacteraceae bacterium]
MDLNHQPESIQRTMILAEDRNGHQHINSLALPDQQVVLPMPKYGRRRYPTDLTDAQWLRIAPLLPPNTSNGHQHNVELREVVNGILYVVCDGHTWGSFPYDLPPRGTVYSYFKRWQTDGSLQQILEALSPEESEVTHHQEPPVAASGHLVSGGTVSDGLVAERDNIDDTISFTDVRGNQAVSKAVLSTTHDLSVVVPTRNEHENIWPLLESLRNALHGLRVEVIFVDDSDDDTPDVIKDASSTMSSSQFDIELEHRLAGNARAGGLATAVVHGMNRAQAEYVAVIDADLQHPPELLRVFYDQAVAQHADLVVASRYLKGGSHRGLAGVGRRFISKGLKWTAKLLFPGQLLRISDPLGGFFLLRRSLLANVALRPIGYKILLEILLRCQWRHVLEVPYHFQARAHGQSKANMQQGILALRHMLRLWREVPAAGRVWKIILLILLNVLITLALLHINKSFPWVWATLSMVVFAVMACLDFVLFNRFIFPYKVSLQRITIPTNFIVDANTDGQFEAMRYADRLTAEAKRDNNGSHQEESKEYTEGQDHTPIAPTALEKTLVTQSITSFQAPRPVGRRRRRLLSIAGIVLLVVL